MRAIQLPCLALGCLWVLACGRISAAGPETSFQPPPLKVPAGFTVQLAAAPPLVRYPMMACFDPWGRLYIAESRGRNLEKKELLEQRGRFIRMLEDTNDDGVFDKSTIFADRLVMPEGALWYRESLFVLSSPYLWRFQDTDDDGVADVREKLLGYMDFNGKANQHGAYLDPSGRLLFSGGIFGYDLAGRDGRRVARGAAAGIFSCRTDGSDLQVFGNGGINPVEIAFTAEGEMLSTCAIFDSIGGRHDALVHWVRGATIGPKDYAPPVLKQTGFRIPALRRWGQVAPSGLMRYRGVAFGARYQDSFFAAQFNTARVVNTRLRRAGSTFHGEDETFLSSTSRDFHPTDVLEDADGSLLVIDTGGWFLISCPHSKVARPEIPGAIYRIRKTATDSKPDPRGQTLNWIDVEATVLAQRLDDPRPVVRDRAMETLVQRGPLALEVLRQTLGSASARARRNGVWTLSRIGSVEATGIVRLALQDTDNTVRQAAIRTLGVLRDERAVSQLLALLEDDTAPVRRAAATALGEIGNNLAVEPLLLSLTLAEDDHAKHAIVYALIEIGDFDTLLAGLTSSNPQVQLVALRALDQLAPERLAPRHVVPLFQTDDAHLKQLALEIVTSREDWGDQIVGLLSDWTQGTLEDPRLESTIHAAVVGFSGNERIQAIVRAALDSPRTPSQVQTSLIKAVARLRQVPASWIEPLGQLLRSNQPAKQLDLISALAWSGTRQLNQHLKWVGDDESMAESVRLAAWRCLAASGEPLPLPPFELLLEQMSGPMAPLDRLLAARAVAHAQLNRHQQLLIIETLSRVGPLELPTLVEALVQVEDAEIAAGVLRALEHSKAAAAVRVDQLQRLLQSVPDEFRIHATHRFPQLRANDQQIAEQVRKTESRLSPGNSEHGKNVFFGHRAACSACHAVGNNGGQIGPDLSAIGKIRTRRDLLESILFPSMSIANGYETYLVETNDGRTLQGVLQRSDARWLVMRNAQRENIVIPHAEVKSMTRSSHSIMPQGLASILDVEQLSDLLAYLESLGRE